MKTSNKLLFALAIALAIIVARPSPAGAFLDKTRFLAHLGVAYFAFHHWVMKPYSQGAFAAGAPHRTAAVVKGGIALLFAYHEVGVAKKIAAKSSDPLLQKLNTGLDGLMGNFSSIGERMKAGNFNPADIAALTKQTTTLNTQATAAGSPIKDVPATIPGT